ncbi:MAG: phytanoyl-CoA dioxygenase family protein [Candidatus Poribacteria bacterium]|nr:phytanoyl-CoA dioxygenase family protein [Candidatus Poribacteria bacterium]
MKPLSQAQIEQSDREGYLLVSGLIPEEIAAKAEAAMWRCAGLDPDEPPASWENAPGGIRLYNDTDLKNCYTPQCLAAAAQLTGEDPSTFGKSDTHPKTYCAPDFLEAQERGEDLTRFFRWDCTYAINIYPSSGEWTVPTPHVDHSMQEHNHKTFPPVFRIGALIYLNDIERHGGGTLVWPGSHHTLEALAKQQPDRYAYRHTVNAGLDKIDFGAPDELSLKRGDVLFLHHLCAHSGSVNLSNRPRFALNMKW